MKKEAAKPVSYWRWILRIFLVSAALSAALSLASGVALEGAGYALAVSVLVAFVLLGILFDVIGVAVTAADARPFHSMASHRERGAKEALYLLRNAEKVSSFCNDVVGDICGIVSGSTAAVIVSRLQADFGTRTILISIAVTALISGVTIGGKAIGKRLALGRSKEVVFRVGRILRVLRIGR
jgi:Mg2+/Co2+ transporter CorB